MYFPTKYEHIRNIVSALRNFLPSNVFVFTVKTALHSVKNIFNEDELINTLNSNGNIDLILKEPFNAVITHHRKKAVSEKEFYDISRLNQTMLEVNDKRVDFNVRDYSDLYGENSPPLFGSYRVTLDEDKNFYDSDSLEYAGRLRPFKIPDYIILIADVWRQEE